MNRFRLRSAIAATLTLASAGPVLAHHRQTPPLVRITTTGDTTLPRLPVWGQTLLLSVGAPGAKVITAAKIRNLSVLTPIGSPDSNENPIANKSGGVGAWDTTAGPGSGRTIFRVKLLSSQQEYIGDPDGISRNPSLDPVGVRIAWETEVSGVSQIMYRDTAGARQLSHGTGPSHNPVVGIGGRLVAYDSTAAPSDGHDTGIAQIWLGNPSVANPSVGCVTCTRNGTADSQFPSLSQDNRALVFQSKADLAGDGHDTGVAQVFLYDTLTKNFARITNDPAGCTLPSAQKIIAQGVRGEYRIAYGCGNQAYFYDVKKDKRKHLIIDGDTTRIVTELGNHFFILTTTADLLAGFGQTSGHQVYLWNEFKKELEVPSPVEDLSSPGTAALWFPARGIPAAN